MANEESTLSSELAKQLSLNVRHGKNLTTGLAGATLGLEGVSMATRMVGPLITSLAKAFLSALKEQRTVTQAFVTTGRGYMLGTKDLTRTLDMHGLAFHEATKVFSTAIKTGMQDNIQGNMQLLHKVHRLGLDVRSMTGVLLKTTDVLGMTGHQSEEFAASIIETGAAYGLHSDLLIQAIDSLIASMKQTQASFGPGLAATVASAMPELIGMFGAAQADNLKAVFSQLFGGTQQATMTALKLGLGVQAVNPRDKSEVVSTVLRALEAAGGRMAGMRGSTGAGLIAPQIMERFGFGPEFLVLFDNLGKTTEKQYQATLKQLNEQAFQNDLMAQLGEAFRPFTIMALRLLNAIAVPLSYVAEGINIMIDWISAIFDNSIASYALFGLWLPRIFGVLVATKVGGWIKSAFIGLPAILMTVFSKAFWKGALAAISRILAFFGPWGILLGIIGAAVGWMLFKGSEEQKTNEEILEEQRRLNAHFIGENAAANLAILAQGTSRQLAAIDSIAAINLEGNVKIENLLDATKEGHLQTAEEIAMSRDIVGTISPKFRTQ